MAWMWALFLTVLAITSGAVSASPGRAHLTVVGATSVLAYLRRAVPEWESHHTGFTVSLSGGGSVAGLVEVSQGRASLAVSDIPPRKEWTGSKPLVAVPLGRLPVIFIVNPTVPVRQVSLKALRALLAGRETTWPGTRRPVVVVTRPLASGALQVVRLRVLGGQRMSPRAIVQLSNGAMLAAVRETPGAIGFLETGRVPAGVRTLGINGRAYSAQSPADWPYFSTPTLYYRADASPEVRDLAQFLASREFRAQYGITGDAS